MQNLSLPSKQSALIKPVEESNKNAALNSQLNKNSSKSQDNLEAKNAFQSMLNKQVQAKRAQENASISKPINKPVTKNAENAQQKNKAADAPNAGAANASGKVAAEEQSNQNSALNKPENVSGELNLQPKNLATDKDILVKDENTRKMTEDAAILAALMQDVSNATPQTLIDPAVLKMSTAANQSVTNGERALLKASDSISSSLDNPTHDLLAKDLQSALVENKNQQNPQNGFNDSKGQQQWESSLASAMQSVEVKPELALKDQPLTALKEQVVDAASWKALDNKESLTKDFGSKESNLTSTSLNPLQNAQLNNNASMNPLIATSAPGSSNQILAYPGKSGWDQAISQKVMWMLGAGEQSATLTLNPPDLGPVQVVVSVNNNQADTTFISDNADVRQALQDGLEHLRERMEASGIQLGQANINAGQQSQQHFQEAVQRSFSGQVKSQLTSSAAEPTSRIISRETNGLVDTFA